MTWTPWSLQSWQGGPSTEHVKGITEQSPSQGQTAHCGREAPRNGTGRGGACWCGRPLRGPFQAGCRLGTDGHLGRTGKCAENILNSEYADYFPAPWILNFTLIYCINNLVTSVGITSLHFPLWQSWPSIYKLGTMRNFLAAQWLGLGAFTAMGQALIPGQGILQAEGSDRKKNHTVKIAAKAFCFFYYCSIMNIFLYCNRLSIYHEYFLMVI